MVGSKAKSKGTPSHTARESFGSLPPPAPRAADSGPSVSATSLGKVPPWSGTAPSATGTPAQTKQSYADALSQNGKNTGGKKGSGKKGKDLPLPRIMEEIAVQIYRTDVDLQVAAEMHKLNSAGCRDPFFLALWGDYERHGALPNGSQYEVITRCLENLCAAEAAMAAHTATQPAQSNADATASEAAQPASEAAQPSPCPILAASPKITAPKVTHGIAPSLANASPACSGLSGAPATATQAAQPTANPEIPPASGSAQQRQQQFASNPIPLDAATLRPLVAEIVTAALHSGELANALANLPQAAPSNVPRPIPMSAPPPATAASVAPQQFVGFPTRSATVTMTTPGAHCSICGRYVRGGALAMSVHQATSSRCAAARGETTDGREPCPHCGKKLAANDNWARQQHEQFCPGLDSDLGSQSGYSSSASSNASHYHRGRTAHRHQRWEDNDWSSWHWDNDNTWDGYDAHQWHSHNWRQ